jgi:hypothetical protein
MYFIELWYVALGEDCSCLRPCGHCDRSLNKAQPAKLYTFTSYNTQAKCLYSHFHFKSSRDGHVAVTGFMKLQIWFPGVSNDTILIHNIVKIGPLVKMLKWDHMTTDMRKHIQNCGLISPLFPLRNEKRLTWDYAIYISKDNHLSNCSIIFIIIAQYTQMYLNN